MILIFSKFLMNFFENNKSAAILKIINILKIRATKTGSLSKPRNAIYD